MTKKNLIILLIILVVSGGIYVYFRDSITKEPQENEGLYAYSSQNFDLALRYPRPYFLTERNESSSERLKSALILALDTPENRRVMSGEEPGREFPPTITIGIYQNLENYTAEEWVRGMSFSNFKLSDGKLSTTTVGEELALAYTATGLYENKNIVLARNNLIYMFTVFYFSPTDQIIKDFDSLLKTVKFTPIPDTPQRTSLSGTYLCLPHTDQTGPQTEECAIGLKTGDGLYYALDFGPLSQNIPSLKSGDRISAHGLLVPKEQLNTNMWNRYPITGIFSVTDSLKKL